MAVRLLDDDGIDAMSSQPPSDVVAVDEVLTESRSAKEPGRPIFNSLMSRVRKGEIASILSWKMDRLARNHLDTGHILQALVSPEEFERAQELIGRPGRSHKVKHEFAYAGLIRCGYCGGTMVPEAHTKRSGKRFVYYRCRSRADGRPCPNPCLPEVTLERQLEGDLKRICLPPRAVDWIHSRVRAKLDATLAEQSATRSGWKKDLADAGRESDALVTLKLRDQVDDETFERRRLELLERQARLRLKLEQPGPSRDQVTAHLEAALRLSASLPRLFREGDAVCRRAIFQTICANPTARDRKALYTAKKPWSFIEGTGLVRSWSGQGESNPWHQLGKLRYYHYTMPAQVRARATLYLTSRFFSSPPYRRREFLRSFVL